MTTPQRICAVTGCDASGRDFGTFLFAVPPADSPQRQRWQEALGSDSRRLAESDLVCWSHFELGDLCRDGSHFRPAASAVPTRLLGLLMEGNPEQVCRLCARKLGGEGTGNDLAKMYTSEDSSLFLNLLLGDLEDSLSRLACEECYVQVMCSVRLIRNCKSAARELDRVGGRTQSTEEVLLGSEHKAEMDVFGEIPIDPVDLEVKLEVESLDSSSDAEDDGGSFEEGSDGQYECSRCSFSCSTKQELGGHMIKHRIDSMAAFKCKFCSFTCLESSELASHIGKHEECKKEPPTKKKKQTDDSTGPFECTECPLIFETRRQLASHKKKHNGKVRKTKPPKDHDGLYECEFCDFKSELRQALAGHRSSHSEQIRKTKPPEKIYDSVCPICGKVLATRGSFLTHMKIHNNQRDFSCDLCGKQFFKKKQRDMHVESFHEKKLFICKVCGVTCKWENSLERHMLKHEANSYKYACTQCDKKFLTAYLLKAHMTKHTGHQVFCEMCGAGFRFNFLLTQHKIRDHDVQVEGVKLYKRFQKGMRKGVSKRKKEPLAEISGASYDPASSTPHPEQLPMMSFQQIESPQVIPSAVGTGQQVSNSVVTFQ